MHLLSQPSKRVIRVSHPVDHLRIQRENGEQASAFSISCRNAQVLLWADSLVMCFTLSVRSFHVLCSLSAMILPLETRPAESQTLFSWQAVPRMNKPIGEYIITEGRVNKHHPGG